MLLDDENDNDILLHEQWCKYRDDEKENIE